RSDSAGIEVPAIRIGDIGYTGFYTDVNMWYNRIFGPGGLEIDFGSGKIDFGKSSNTVRQGPVRPNSLIVQGTDEIRLQNTNQTIAIYGDSQISMFRQIRMNNYDISDVGQLRIGNYLGLLGGEIRGASSGNIALMGQKGLNFYVGSSQKMRFRTNIFLDAALDTNGYAIIGTSDERWKDVRGLRTENDLENLMKINYVDFTWKDPARGGDDLGFIAQQVRLVAPEIITESEDGILGYNTGTYVNFIGHAVQQLALREENTHKVASQALLNSE